MYKMSSRRARRGVGFLLSLLVALTALVAFPATAMAEGEIPVSGIEGVPPSVAAGESLNLSEATATPTDATNQEITWSIKSEGTTGATLEGSILSTTAEGTVVVTATIIDGIAEGSHYIEDFSITVEPPLATFIPVTDITDVPAAATVETSLSLTGTIIPENATHQSIEWSVSGDGGTGATIVEGVLTAVAEGEITLTATVSNGLAEGKDYTKNFVMAITAALPADFIPVTEITGMPAAVTAGKPLDLSLATVAPENATNRAITWSIADAGTTGAVLAENALTAETVGKVTLSATIPSGKAEGADYTQSFILPVRKFPK